MQLCSDEKILEVDELHASFSKRDVIRGVSFDVDRNEIVGLIGANGAGKSTLLKALFGFASQKGATVRGKIFFNGCDVTFLSPLEKTSAGMGYLVQGGEIFSNLSVEDNLILAGRNQKKLRKNNLDLVYMVFPKLIPLRRKRSGLLSGGERQMLALGLIMMLKPKLMLLDEPTANLSPAAIASIKEALMVFAKEGDLSILLVEQNIDVCLDLSNRVIMMRSGQIVDIDSPVNIRNSEKLDRFFLG